jgi:uncharacterized protein YmfQ (DUF2313 family)
VSEPSQETVDRYAAQGAALMPPGQAFSQRMDAEIRAFLEGIAIAFARVHEDAAALRRELLPSQAVELLPDWERVTGLPNCTDAPSDIAGRQADLVSHLVASGGQSKLDFKAIAAALGFELELQHEYLPMTCIDPCTSPVASIEWVWHQLVTILSGPSELRDLLECRLNHHLHLYGHFRFGDEAPSYLELDQGGALELEQGGFLELEQS